MPDIEAFNLLVLDTGGLIAYYGSAQLLAAKLSNSSIRPLSAAVPQIVIMVKNMGEIKVKVKLTNASDQVLVRRGLLTNNQVRVYETEATVDTGAVRCVLPLYVAQQLGLDMVSHRGAEYADGRHETVGITAPFLSVRIGLYSNIHICWYCLSEPGFSGLTD